MKRLILCADNRSLADEGYWTYFVAMSQTYAKVHGIDFKFETMTSGVEDRHLSWNRIPLFQKYAEEYDEIMWLDTDATVINHTVDAFEIIKTAPESKTWSRKPGSTPVIYALCDKPHSKLACAGILLLDCRDKATIKRVLQEWWTDLPDPKYKMTHPWDQVVWTKVWSNDESKRSYIRVADLWSFREEEKDQVFIHMINSKFSTRLFEAKKYFYRMLNSAKRCKNKIGIHIDRKDPAKALYLRHALEACGHTVEFLISDSELLGEGVVAKPYPYFVYQYKELTFADYCVVICYGIPLDTEVEKVKKAGTRLVTVYESHRNYDSNGSHSYQNLLKSSDQIWTSADCKSLVLSLYEDKIQQVPEVYTNIASLDFGKQVTYSQPTHERMDIVILASGDDPTHVIPPLMAIQKYADKIGTIHAVNVGGDSKRIESIMQHMTKRPKLYGSMPIHEILAFFAKPENIGSRHVVFMATESTNKFLIYDTLLAGFPVIHSLESIKAHGYYVGTASESSRYNTHLQTIMTTHEVSKTIVNFKKYIEQYNPYNSGVIEQYKKRIGCKILSKNMSEFDKEALQKDLETPLVISYDNAPTENTKTFERSLKKNGWQYKFVGEGETWRGFPNKLNGYYNALKELHDDKVVVVSDARDVFCLRSSKWFMHAYKSMESDFIVSTEATCSGSFDREEPLGNCIPVTEYWKYHNIKRDQLPNHRYVNSGLIVGKAKLIRRFFQWSIETAQTDDQIALCRYINLNPSLCKLDTELRLVHTSAAFALGGCNDLLRNKKDCPTLFDLMGRGVFFLHLVGQFSESNRIYYKLVKTIVEGEIYGSTFDKYGMKREPKYNEKNGVQVLINGEWVNK